MSKKKKTFQFKPNRQVPAMEAPVVGAELDRINKVRGELRPEHVVDESRPSKAVLHPLFEWNDAVAGEKYRVHQARNIINVVQIVEDRDGKPSVKVPAFVNVAQGGYTNQAERRYVPIAEAMADDDTRRTLVERCLRKLLCIRDEYRQLVEFSNVWTAVDDLDKSLAAV